MSLLYLERPDLLSEADRTDARRVAGASSSNQCGHQSRRGRVFMILGAEPFLPPFRPAEGGQA